MAVKLITPTTPILATSTVSGGVRARRGILPTGVIATSTVSGAFRLQWPGSGPYLVPYTPPVAPPTIALPSTDDFAQAVYDQLNLDNLVGTDDFKNLITDPLFINGTSAWVSATPAQWSAVRSTEQTVFGAYSIKCTRVGAGAEVNAVASPVMSLIGGNTYVASVYVYISSGFAGSYVRVTTNNFLNSVADQTYYAANMSIRNRWQRIWIVFTPDLTDVIGNPIYVVADPATPPGLAAFYVAAPQLELGNSPNVFTDNSLYAPAKVITQSFLGAIGAAYEQMYDLANNGQQWSALLDLNRVPDEGLSWFGQLSGTRVDPALSFAQQRQQIRTNPGWHRGTLDAIAQAIRPMLTGTQAIQIVERDTSPYHFNIATYAGETPDSNQVQIMVGKVKPAGLQFTYTSIPGTPGTAASYANVYFDFLSYQVIYDEVQTYNDLYLHP